MERRVKGWSRVEKEALIAGDWDRLPDLAKRRTPPFETRPKGRSSG
jgi:putative endonuclease